MLIEFSFSNYRSFRGENTLSLESLIKKKESLPLVAIYGKNGGGKSNLIRAFWLAVKFICNAQMTQGAGAPVPVDPFKNLSLRTLGIMKKIFLAYLLFRRRKAIDILYSIIFVYKFETCRSFRRIVIQFKRINGHRRSSN